MNQHEIYTLTHRILKTDAPTPSMPIALQEIAAMSDAIGISTNDEEIMVLASAIQTLAETLINEQEISGELRCLSHHYKKHASAVIIRAEDLADETLESISESMQKTNRQLQKLIDELENGCPPQL